MIVNNWFIYITVFYCFSFLLQMSSKIDENKEGGFYVVEGC